MRGFVSSFICTALLVAFSYAEEGLYKALGVVQRIEGDRVTVNVKADDCYGPHELLLKNPEQLNLKTGQTIIFKASANPCRGEGEVYLLGVDRQGYESEREMP